MAPSARWAQEIRELEDALVRYPDESAEIMLELADAHRLAGDPDRALAVLGELVSAGGEDGELARVALADLLFDLGRDEEAYAQLEHLRAARPSSPAPCQVAGELLEERGELAAALKWFNLAVARLGRDELDQLHGEFGWASYAALVARGRQRVRRRLGFPADELDRAVPPPPTSLRPRGFPTADELLTDLDAAGGVAPAREARMLFWPCGQLQSARARWPALIDPDGPDEAGYHALLEAKLRALSERGIGRVTVVPGTAAGLADFAERTGGDPLESSVRQAYLDELTSRGVAVSWPPPRNSPCWCGSAAKYKRCCGSPAIAERQP